MTVEERVWNALAKPGKSKEVWERVNKLADMANPRISWQRVEEALKYWLDTGMVRVTNKRFWRTLVKQAAKHG